MDTGQFTRELRIPCPEADVEYSRAPQPSTTRSHSNRVAVCVFGELRNLNMTVKTLREKLFEVLKADVFVSTADTGDIAMLHRLCDDYPVCVKRVHTAEDYSRQALLDHFARLENANYTGLLELAVRMNGTFHNFLSPLNFKFNWHGGFQLRHLQTCDDMITERERARGQKYRAVVFSRPDNFFLVPHPPIKNLGTPTKHGRCFIPDIGLGKPGDYVTDTGATCDRKGAAAYMTLGKLVAEIPHKVKCVDPEWCTSEDLLKCGLRWQSVQIISVQPLFYLSCDPAKSQVISESNPSDRKRRKLAGSTGCSLVREHAVRQNYGAEFEAAQKLSERVASKGWELTEWGCPRFLSVPSAKHDMSTPLMSAGTCPKLIDPLFRNFNASPDLSGSVALLWATMAIFAVRLVRRAATKVNFQITAHQQK